MRERYFMFHSLTSSLMSLQPHTAPLRQAVAMAFLSSPFDNAGAGISTLMSTTVAKTGSLVGIVGGAIGYGHGQSGTAKAIFGTIGMGSMVALGAPQIVTWISGLMGN